MAVNNGYILDLIRFIANKTQTGGYLSPQEFNTVLYSETLAHFKTKVGLPEQYVPGTPIPSQVYEITAKITQDLLPFKVWMGEPNGTPPLMIDTNGIAQIPSDLYYPGPLDYWYIPSGDCDPIPESCKVDCLTDGQWSDIISHPIRKPTLQYPACNFQANFIRFAPTNLQKVNFIYIRFPVQPVFDYYLDAYGEEQYLLPGTSHTLLTGEQGSQGQLTGTVNSLSVEIEFDDVNKLDIAYRICSTLGINMREVGLTQYAEMNTQSGQKT